MDYSDLAIHTNTVEGAFSIFKRGMKGVYQHCGEQHLHRYLAEFEFRDNTRIANGFDDKAHSAEALKGISGASLTAWPNAPTLAVASWIATALTSGVDHFNGT